MNKNKGIDSAILSLLKAPFPELDYGFVMDALKKYKGPRVKLNHLLKIGAIIRIKKGLYIFGEDFAKSPYSLEILANKAFGPSYVSLEWALQYHNLIPERVVVVTSVTFKRKKEFKASIANFTYEHLPKSAYAVGICLEEVSKNRFALVACKEKALADFLRIRRGQFSSVRSMLETLLEDMRIDEEDLIEFDLVILQTLYKKSPHSSLKYLIKALEKIKGS